jgi:hypothetical protein
MCRTHEKVRNTYKLLLGKPAGKRSGGRRIDWDNVRMDLKKMALEDAAKFIELSSSGTQL